MTSAISSEYFVMTKLTMCILNFALFTGLAGVAPAHGSDVSQSEVDWAQEGTTDVPSRNIDLSAWESYKGHSRDPSTNEYLTDPILVGSIDLHAHYGPDTYDRQWDAFEIARLAYHRGMRGAVFKSHWTESASLAYLIRKQSDVPAFEAFGGLALNATVGGINPQAVRHFAEIDGKYGRIVWMPTHDSEHEVKYLKETRPYVSVSRNGELLPQVLEVLDLIKHYDLTLATGHVSTSEMLQILREAKKLGIEKLIVTHPDLGPQYTNATIDELKEAIALGGYIEVTVGEVTRDMKDHFIEMIRVLGPRHFVISSDSGLVGSRNHADNMVVGIRALRDAGFKEPELDLMFRKNPAFLVGLTP